MVSPVERNPVRVGAVASVQGDGVATRVEPVHGRGTCGQRRSPWVLVVVLEEDPALPINPAIRAENQVVGGMVGVGGSGDPGR